jgi:hypothetical protein
MQSIKGFPVDLQDMIFLASDWKLLNKWRIVQSDYVKRLTEYDNMAKAAHRGNFMNLKWLYNNGYLVY